jgi:hypothetical protein
VRKAFLVLYDYGQGGVWAHLLADSADEIHREFPMLRVYEEPPPWMKTEDLDAVSASMTIDIGNRDHPFLAALLKT